MDKLQAFYYKMKTDFSWFAGNFLKIRDKKSRLIDFQINDAQRVFLDMIEEDKKNGKPLRYIILKARQLGFSTFTEGYIYWDTSTQELRNSLIVAHEDKATQNLFQMSKLFYEMLPDSIRPMTKYSNQRVLQFENPTNDLEEKRQNPGLRSKITLATAGTSDTGRSGTYHNVHVSEIAFFPNAKNTMTAIMQCVPDEPNTMVVMESTANGIGGYFYDMWNDAVEGKNDFTPLFFPWFADKNYTTPFNSLQEKHAFIERVNAIQRDEGGKEYHTEEYILKEEFGLTYEQLNWRDKTIANKCGGDLDMFHQEYPATPVEAFISSGRPRFNMRALKEYELGSECQKKTCNICKSGIKYKVDEDPNGLLKIWQDPEPNKYYVIGCDVAEGLITGDYSVAVVMDEKLNVVAKWRGHIDPDLFGDILVDLAMYYNEAYLAIENNNHGLTTIKSVLRREYFNLFYTKTYDKVTDQMTKKVGWSTTRKTKPMAIDTLAEYLRERYLNIKDMDIISELYSYVIDSKGSTNAQQGKHDDCVMALAITLQAFLEGKGEDYVPEVPKDQDKKKPKNRDFDTPEIVDPLFEEDKYGVECT